MGRWHGKNLTAISYLSADHLSAPISHNVEELPKRPVDSKRKAASDALVELLREARELRAVSQRDLSHRLGQDFTYIAKIELGRRRLDVVELIEICFILGIEPAEFVERLASEMRAASRSSRRSKVATAAM